jgi:DNA-binding NarL/FixJ family response regulator
LPAELGGLSISLDLGARGGLRAVPSKEPAPRSTTGRAFSTVLATDEELPATLFLLFRAESAPPLDEEDVADIQVSCRHLSMAVRLWYRDRFSRQGAEALANTLNAAAVVVDQMGYLKWMNRSAGEWVRERRMVIAQGRIAEVPGMSIDLPRALREATHGAGRQSITVNATSTAEIMPISMPVPGGGIAVSALMIFRDRPGCKEAAGALAANFRLTATEIDLAIALWKGILIAEYAAQRSVAMSTVRTQLKSLLSKTHSRRQSDIVSLVARMMPLTGSPSNG